MKLITISFYYLISNFAGARSASPQLSIQCSIKKSNNIWEFFLPCTSLYHTLFIKYFIISSTLYSLILHDMQSESKKMTFYDPNNIVKFFFVKMKTKKNYYSSCLYAYSLILLHNMQIQVSFFDCVIQITSQK